jgi:N-methylhydantoinase A
MSGYRLGIDIGGTFTDIVLLDGSGGLQNKKILSTPDDYSRAIEEGVREILDRTGVRAEEVIEVAHGTTVATNAIIERKGVTVALITTAGFRDVLEIARFRAPRLYDVSFRKPEPLVERRLRFTVPERITAAGTVDRPLDRSALDAIVDQCRVAKVDAVAVCFINAYVDPRHEEEAGALLREKLPGISVTLSSELVPQIQEYERTSTAVVNAYIRPVIERYIDRLEARLRDIGIGVPLNIMQSNGGVLPARVAAEKPIFVIESGPAAGVVGAHRLGRKLGFGDCIVFDMGGTTAKATIIADGRFSMAPETEVGGDAALGHRMTQGSGYLVQAPTIDIAEVGAGGGSIAWIDSGGGIQVGPHSAGAMPGPVCYDQGGTEPTVTDANLHLGYINPGSLVGGELALNRDKAEAALGAIAGRLGQDATVTAYGIHLIANARMMRALSAVSSERGLDPAGFPLMAFGGNGGVHVCNLAEALGCYRVLVPPAAGLFSALGLLFADIEHQCIRAFYQAFDTLDLEKCNALLTALQEEADGLVAGDGYAPEARRVTCSADLRYVGQNTALTLEIPVPPLDAAKLAQISESFAVAHEATFGYRSDEESVQFVTLKAVGQGVAAGPRLPDRVTVPAGAAKSGHRNAYYGDGHGWIETPIVGRADLTATPRQGPLIVEEYDSTTVVRPGWRASVDDWNNILLERPAADG